MRPQLSAIAIALMIGYLPQNPSLENQAISRVQQMLVSRLESGLPDRSFSAWVRQIVGPEAGVGWQLTECGEQKSGAGVIDIQACVEMSALRPDGRKVVIFTHVGGFKQGLTAIPKIQFTVIEHRGEIYEVPGLRSLYRMLRSPLVKKSGSAARKPPALPSTEKKTYVLPSLAGVPEKTPSSGKPLDEPSPQLVTPPSRGVRRVSEGVLIGNAVNKFIPNYPPVAKQLRLEGQVMVEVTIAEDGRVSDSKAISGPDILRPAAEEAARKWIFKPTLLNKVPVKIQGILTFVFTRP